MNSLQLDYEGLSNLFDRLSINPSLLHKRIERFNPSTSHRQRHYVIFNDHEIEAMAATSLENEQTLLVLWHVSVDPEYRGRGRARHLIRMAFADAQKLKVPLLNQGFSSDLNRKHLGGSMIKIAKNEYPDVPFTLSNST